MKHVLCAAGLLACPAVAVAQQPVPAALSLADAIAIAREQNPAYRQALNNRGPAAWGTRSAYSSLLLPSVTVSGGVTYSGPGQQRFLTADFSQTVATLSSSYNVGLSYELSGAVLSQRSEEHTSELQSLAYLVCRLLLEKKKKPRIRSLKGRAHSSRWEVLASGQRPAAPGSREQQRAE